MLVRSRLVALTSSMRGSVFSALSTVGPFILEDSISQGDVLHPRSWTSPVRTDTPISTMITFREDELAVTADETKKKRKPVLTWEDKFALLRVFKKIHGHCRVPRGYTVGGFCLGGWVATQRKEYIKHRFGFASCIMNEKRVIRLEKAGFEWNPVSETKAPLKIYAWTMPLALSASV